MGFISINIHTDVKESLVDSLASTNVCSVAAAVRLSDGKKSGMRQDEREKRVDCCFEFEITPIPSHLSWADRSQAVISWIILDFPFQTYRIKNTFTQLCAPFVSTFFLPLFIFSSHFRAAASYLQARVSIQREEEVMGKSLHYHCRENTGLCLSLPPRPAEGSRGYYSLCCSLSVPLTPPYDTLRQWVIKCQQFYI